MYISAIEEEVRARNGETQVLNYQAHDGSSRLAGVIAIAEDASNVPWMIFGRADQPADPKAHVMRFHLWTLEHFSEILETAQEDLELKGDFLALSGEERLLAYSRSLRLITENFDLVPSVVRAYHLKGGRELKAILARQEYVAKKGAVTVTDWMSDVLREIPEEISEIGAEQVTA